MRAVILAGGVAARFGGRPKGLATVGGVRILDRVITACRTAFGTAPLLIANDPAAPDWAPGIATLPDLVPGLGPLGGLRSAVEQAPAPTVVVAWDMPFLSAALLRRLADGLHDADICLPASAGPRGVEPLCAAYGPACGAAFAAALDRGDRHLLAAHDDLRVRRLPLAEVEQFGPLNELFFNVNSPDDLQVAEQRAAARTGA